MKMKRSCPTQARCRKAAKRAVKAWARGVDIVTETHVTLGVMGQAQAQARRRASWKAHRATEAALRGVPRKVFAPLSRRKAQALDLAELATNAACGARI